MSQTSDSRAVKLARAHVEAWAHKDFETARNGLAGNVTATQSSTTGTVRVTDSNGDDGCALLMVATPVDGPPYGKLTIHNARLYRFDENDKIAAEHVIFYTVPD